MSLRQLLQVGLALLETGVGRQCGVHDVDPGAVVVGHDLDAEGRLRAQLVGARARGRLVGEPQLVGPDPFLRRGALVVVLPAALAQLLAEVAEDRRRLAPVRRVVERSVLHQPLTDALQRAVVLVAHRRPGQRRQNPDEQPRIALQEPVGRLLVCRARIPRHDATVHPRTSAPPAVRHAPSCTEMCGKWRSSWSFGGLGARRVSRTAPIDIGTSGRR